VCPIFFRQVDVPYVSLVTCNNVYPDWVGDDAFCAGSIDENAPANPEDINDEVYGNQGDACQGDSGGPIVAYVDGVVKLAGVVSWGVNCGSYYGVYGKIVHDWLSEQQAFSSFGFNYKTQLVTPVTLIADTSFTSITIENKLNTFTGLSLVQITGADAEYFALTADESCSFIITVSGGCELTIQFSPTDGAREYNALMNFGDDSWLPVALMGEALDESNKLLETDGQALYAYGDLPWYLESGELISGKISHNQTSSILFNLDSLEDSLLTFDIKVSSEEDFDYYYLLINDEQIDFGSGNSDWTSKEYELKMGKNQLVINYVKDELESSFNDEIRLANVFLADTRLTDEVLIGTATATVSSTVTATPSSSLIPTTTATVSSTVTMTVTPSLMVTLTATTTLTATNTATITATASPTEALVPISPTLSPIIVSTTAPTTAPTPPKSSGLGNLGYLSILLSVSALLIRRRKIH